MLILVLLYRLRKRPALEFTAAVVLCGFLEYMTSLVMEISTGGTKWWDYSGYFLNLDGRICAEDCWSSAWGAWPSSTWWRPCWTTCCAR